MTRKGIGNPGHNHRGNCWDFPGKPTAHDACVKHCSPRGDCAECPRCATCDAEANAATHPPGAGEGTK